MAITHLNQMGVRVLRRAAMGDTTAQTATALNEELGTKYSSNYIQNVRSTVCQLLGARNITHAVHIAYQLGIFLVGDEPQTPLRPKQAMGILAASLGYSVHIHDIYDGKPDV